MAYGGDRRQYGVLGLPARSRPLATVVMIHGGGWLATAALRSFVPMQRALTALGYATWNLEYRGVGVGGGFPGTFEDIAAGVDRLAHVGMDTSGYENSVLTDKVAFLGQSAGAHLATWAASRNDHTPGGRPALEPRVVVSMGGPLNLKLAARHGLAGDIVPNFMGGMPAEVPEHYAVGDPVELVPAVCPVWAIHGEQDTVVPAEQGLSYVRSARRAGGTAYFVPVQGTHNQLAAPAGQSWSYVRKILARLAAG